MELWSNSREHSVHFLLRLCNTILTRPFNGRDTRTEQQFDVFEVSKAGDLRRTSVTLANVLRDFGVHARDVLSLGLQVLCTLGFKKMLHQPLGSIKTGVCSTGVPRLLQITSVSRERAEQPTYH